MNWKEKAVEKIAEERKEKPSNAKAKAVYDCMADAIETFCVQDEEFAQAVCQSDKKLSICAEQITKDVGSTISDLEVYKKAASFYFEGATVKFHMTIELDGSAPAEAAAKTSVIDITDLL